jgi:hypothetical protein
MTISVIPSSVSLNELNAMYEKKMLLLESAINTGKPHSELNELYQDLKLIRQQINLRVIEEELKKEEDFND